MINSPWQADDDGDNQSGDNRGDSAHTSISLTVTWPASNFAIRLSAFMLELTITSARQQLPDIAAPPSPDGYHHDQSAGKAPRLNLRRNACSRRPDFSERSLSGQARLRQGNPTNGKEAGSVRRSLIWVCFSGDKFARVIWVISEGHHNNVDRVSHKSDDFWFSDVRYQFPPTTPAYRRNAFTLIISISTVSSLGFFSSEAFDKRTNRVSTDVADKHARYIRDCY